MIFNLTKAGTQKREGLQGSKQIKYLKNSRNAEEERDCQEIEKKWQAIHLNKKIQIRLYNYYFAGEKISQHCMWVHS